MQPRPFQSLTRKQRKVLVTGGAGFVGSNIARHLAEMGHEVLAMDNLVRRGSELNVPALRKKGITFFHGDVRCMEDFGKITRNVDLLIECSAQPNVVHGYDNPRFDVNNNLVGTMECLEFCRKTGAGMIFFSSNRVYSSDQLNSLPMKEMETRFDYDPVVRVSVPGYDSQHGISHDFNINGGHKTIYGVSKAAADLLCQEWARAFDMPIVINRCGVISGEGQFGMPDQGWLVWWALAAFLEMPLKYLGYRGKQVRDILFIQDLCRLIDFEIEKMSMFFGQVFNIGGGRDISLSLIEATALAEEISGVKLTVEEVNESRKDDIKLYLTDNRPVKKILGWKPETSIQEGFERIARWVYDHGNQLKDLYL